MATKRFLSCEYIKHLAKLDLTSTDYKVLLMLISDKATQAQIARDLDKQSQNVNRSIANLKGFGLITVESVDGRNKYYKAVTKVAAPKNDTTVDAPQED